MFCLTHRFPLPFDFLHFSVCLEHPINSKIPLFIQRAVVHYVTSGFFG